MKKFKRMIYKNHFDRMYLEAEQDKQALETKIEQALNVKDFETAGVWVEKLEAIVDSLKNIKA